MCDNGPPLVSEFVQELAKFMDIKIYFTPLNFPSASGLVEKFMKTLRTIILSYVQQDIIVQQWDSKSQIIRFIYNNLRHLSTGFSPFELVHGRVARSPLSIMKMKFQSFIETCLPRNLILQIIYNMN